MAFALGVVAFPHHRQRVNSNGRLMINCSMKTTSNNTTTSTNSYGSKYSSTGELLALPGSDNPREFLKLKAKELAQRYEAIVRDEKRRSEKTINFERVRLDGIPDSKLMSISYEKCRQLFLLDVECHTTIGLSILGEKKLNAISALLVWGRRVDNVADGMNGSHATIEDLVRWEQRTTDISEGRPWDIYDVALSDTFSKFPIDLQLFLEMIEGTKMDLGRRTFQDYEQISLYRYHISATFTLLLFQIVGLSPSSRVPLDEFYADVITHAIFLAEADSLRDIAPDASMGRIYLPQDELVIARVTNADIYSGRMSEDWRNFMRGQVKRLKVSFGVCDRVMREVNADGRCWLWAMGLVYQQDVEAIEAADYQNLTKQLPRGMRRSLWAFLSAYFKSHGFV